MSEVAINGSNATNSGFKSIGKNIDLSFITIERTAPSIYQTYFEMFLDAQRIYPTEGVGILGEKSEGVIHHHPLPRVRCVKGQVLEFRFTSLTLPSTACEDQRVIITLVGDYVRPDNVLKGNLYPQPYVVETYKTEEFFSGIQRRLKRIFGGIF